MEIAKKQNHTVKLNSLSLAAASIHAHQSPRSWGTGDTRHIKRCDDIMWSVRARGCRQVRPCQPHHHNHIGHAKIIMSREHSKIYICVIINEIDELHNASANCMLFIFIFLLRHSDVNFSAQHLYATNWNGNDKNGHVSCSQWTSSSYHCAHAYSCVHGAI